MTEVQPVDPARPVIPPAPARERQSVLPVQSGDVPAVSASGVPITPGDPRFMTRDAEGRLVNPDGSVFVPEEPERTVHHALADLESEINGVWHATPSGTESAVVRMRAHLREIRGHVDPNSPQAKADKARAEEARAEAEKQRNAPLPDRAAVEAQRPATADQQRQAEERAEERRQAESMNGQQASGD